MTIQEAQAFINANKDVTRITKGDRFELAYAKLMVHKLKDRLKFAKTKESRQAIKSQLDAHMTKIVAAILRGEI